MDYSFGESTPFRSNRRHNRNRSHRAPAASDWVYNVFKQRECVKFVPSPSGDIHRCSCGRAHKYHIQGDQSAFVSLHWKSEEQAEWSVRMNTKEFRTNAVGTLEFQGTGEGDKAQFIRLSDSTSGANVHRLLTKEWQMELPKLVITVHGSEKRLDLTTGQRQLLISGLIKATRTTDAWIMSIGLSSEGGIGELVGQALTEHQLYARGRVSAIGVMPWGVVDNRDDLQNDEKLKTGAVPYQTMADPLSKGAVLNAAHTHFLMVDNGSVGKWKTEIRFRRTIEKELVKKHNVPMVCLIIEGDRTTLETVLKKVMEGIPVVVCVPAQKNESIRNAADLIAYAYHLSDSKGDISKENRAQMEELLTSHKNADQFNRGTILNLTRMMSFKRLIQIFWMDLHGTDNVATRNLDYAILTSLFSTSAEKKKTDPDNWLKMAMSWDRPDIARRHVFAFPYAKNFPVGSLRKRLEEALVNDKVEFVKLFMDHGVSMHKFLTIKRLEDLYNADKPDYLPQHLKYLLDDVSREKRVPKGQRRINLIQIGLVIEGLMGGTYRSNYTRKKFHLYYKQTEAQTSNNENFKNPFHELLIWAVLMKRQEMAIFMWQKGEEAMAKALVAMKLYRRMAQEADDDDLNQEEIETMRLYSDQFKQKALDILKLGYKDSDKMCYQLLTYELKSWSRHTCLSLAVLAQHRDLIAHPCVQNIITDLWMGALDIRRNSNIKVPISLVTLWPLFTTILHPFPSFRNVIQFIKFKTSEQLREIPKTLQEYLDECEDDHGFSTRHNETSTTSSTSSTSSSDEEKRFGSRNIASEEKSSLVTSAGARRDQFSRGCIRGSNGTQTTKDADQKVHFLIEPSATQELPPEPIFTSKLVLTPETPGSNDLGLTRKIYEYFNAPITKYWFNIIMYVVFILSISYTVLVRMCPWTIPDVEWFVVSYVFTFAIENIRSISISTSRGVWSKFRHWHSKFWNLLESFAIITFLFGFGLRLQVFIMDKESLVGLETSCGEFYERALSKNATEELRKTYEELAYGRVLCVTSVVLWWIRILKFLSVHKTIGPYITMAGKMLIDMSSFITILAVVLISFGLSRQSIIHDRSESLTWQTIWGVFHKPYFMLYGEVYAPEIDPYYDDSGDLIPGVNPGAWVVPVFNTLYLLVANILLINLLIAVFNNTFARVKVESHQIWACQRYEVIMQYEAHPIFPPPFIFISHLKMLIDKIFCSKSKGKFEADRGLKLFLADFEEENLHDWEEELIDDYERMKRREDNKRFEEQVKMNAEKLRKISSHLDDVEIRDSQLRVTIEELSEEVGKVRDLVLAMSNNPDSSELCDIPLEYPSINLTKEKRIASYGSRNRRDSEMSCHLEDLRFRESTLRESESMEDIIEDSVRPVTDAASDTSDAPVINRTRSCCDLQALMWTSDPRPQSSSPSRRGSMPAHSLVQNKNGRNSLKPLNLSHISHAKDSGNISEDSPRTPPPSLNVVSLHSPGRSSRNRNRPFMINSSNSSDDNLGDYSAMSSAKSMADPNRSHSPEMKMSLLRKIQSKVLLKENAAASRSRRPPRRRRLKRLKTVDIKDEERAQDGYQSEILNDLYN